MANWNTSFDSLLASTLDDYRDQFSDNITNKQKFLSLLVSNGFKRTLNGGANILEQLESVQNTTVSSYSGYDIINLLPQDPFTAAKYSWKQIAASMSISGLLKFQNSGDKHRVIDIVKSLFRNAEKSMRIGVNTQLFADGTGNSSKNIGGLAIAVEEGTAWSTYGGINSSTNSGWRNQWTGAVGSFAANGVDSMLTMFYNCSRNGMQPDLIITDQSTYESYERSLIKQERFVKADKKMGDLGFLALSYKEVPFVFDPDCTAGYMYFLTSETFKWVVGAGHEFSSTAMVRPDNQDAESRLILLYCNITVNNRAANGVLTAITNP